MTDLTTPTVDLDLIHVHPNNPRRNAVADDEMVASVASLGIAQALTVMPHAGACPLHEECYTLGAGHRRSDAARKAGLTVVPVLFRDDLVTEAQQLEFMLVENLHRVDLTPVEEAEAYEQLALQGMDADAIAAATGRKATTVKSRMKLTGLTLSSRDRLHAGEMTLVDAEAMLEFAADPAITARLELHLGTPNFRWAIEDARRAQARAEARAAAVAELEKTGVKQVDEGHALAAFRNDEDLRDPVAHDGCLAFVVPTSQWQDPYLVCTDSGRHPVTETREPVQVQSEWEKERDERDARSAARAAAAAVRLTWLCEHFTGMFPARSHATLADVVQAFLPTALLDARWGDVIDPATVLTALGVMPAPTEGGGHDYPAISAAATEYAAALSRAKPTKVLGAFASWMAAVIADQLAQDMTWCDDDVEVLHHLGLWDWLKAAGYPMSDVDKEIRTELEVKHTELAEAS